jgi:FAD:protein FMN transferase
MIYLAGVDDSGPGVIRRFLLPGLFVLALFATLYMRRPDPSEIQHTIALSGPTMGTTWNVTVVVPEVNPTLRTRLKNAITSSLEAVNTSMSTYRPQSELSIFNARRSTEPFAASTHLRYVLERAQRISDQSKGAFDVTIGPLVNAWGFGPKGDRAPPSDTELTALSDTVGYLKLTRDDTKQTIQKKHVDLYVDLSAIAKGYGVDQVSAALDRENITRYLVEIGGEVRGRGLNDRRVPWRLGIEKPVAGERAIQEVIALGDRAMATSGDYRNFREKEGVRVSHTIDPRTRRPISHRGASVTVVADQCVDADGWATALNVMGPVEGLQLAEREGLAALFLTKGPHGTFHEESTKAFRALRAASSRAPSP